MLGGTKPDPVGQFMPRYLQTTGPRKGLKIHPHEHEGQEQRLNFVFPFDGEASTSLVRSQFTNATVAAISDRLRKAKASRDWKLYTIEGRREPPREARTRHSSPPGRHRTRGRSPSTACSSASTSGGWSTRMPGGFVCSCPIIRERRRRSGRWENRAKERATIAAPDVPIGSGYFGPFRVLTRHRRHAASTNTLTFSGMWSESVPS